VLALCLVDILMMIQKKRRHEVGGRREPVIDKKIIIRLLYSSRTLRRPVGINSKIIGSKTRICHVMGIVVTDEVVIILQPYDISGKIIGRNVLTLSDIESIIPV
jgi:hypothetical protein